jgi:hypothetical protein
MGLFSEDEEDFSGQRKQRSTASAIDSQEAKGHCDKINHSLCDGQEAERSALHPQKTKGVRRLAAIQD